MTRSSHIARVLLGLAAVVLLGGCGADSGSVTSASGPPLTRAEYQAKVSRIVSGVSATYGNLSVDPTKIPPGELGDVEKGLRELADQLEQVRPPAEVSDLHADFVAGLRSFADELPDLTTKLKATKDPAAGLEVLLGSEPLQLLLRASQGFSGKGYRLELDGRKE